jgi:hypothetical protein
LFSFFFFVCLPLQGEEEEEDASQEAAFQLSQLFRSCKQVFR